MSGLSEYVAVLDEGGDESMNPNFERKHVIVCTQLGQSRDWVVTVEGCMMQNAQCTIW